MTLTAPTRTLRERRTVKRALKFYSTADRTGIKSLKSFGLLVGDSSTVEQQANCYPVEVSQPGCKTAPRNAPENLTKPQAIVKLWPRFSTPERAPLHP